MGTRCHSNYGHLFLGSIQGVVSELIISSPWYVLKSMIFGSFRGFPFFLVDDVMLVKLEVASMFSSDNTDSVGYKLCVFFEIVFI